MLFYVNKHNYLQGNLTGLSCTLTGIAVFPVRPIIFPRHGLFSRVKEKDMNFVLLIKVKYCENVTMSYTHEKLFTIVTVSYISEQ